MAYIWIIGDSWGDEWGTYAFSGIKPSEGFQHHLEQAGHTVKNLARGGIGNGYALQIPKTAVDKGEEPPTHILQFWTEPFRDFYTFGDNWHKNGWNLVQAVDTISEHLVLKALNIKKELNNPHWAIIGGQAPLPEMFGDRMNSTFYINNWRNDLLKTEFSHYASSIVGQYGAFNQFPHNKDNNKTRNKVLEEANRIMDAMRNSKSFPDNAHPGWDEYKSLLDKLLPWIKSTS